jgi:hypothetical protein
MRKEGEAVLKPNQAALIVTYGNTAHKQRSLDRDLFLLGRSPICDLTLVSPEVAPVHCILQRGVEGWRVRDCSGGRHAVRLNGCVVQEEALNDSDVLQIGAFSFELRLPASRPLPSSAPGVEERPTPLPPTLAELEKQAECLRGLQRDYQALLKQCEARLSEVECAERELCDERAAFERDCVERRVRLEQAERELARRRPNAPRAWINAVENCTVWPAICNAAGDNCCNECQTPPISMKRNIGGSSANNCKPAGPFSKHAISNTTPN